LALDEAVIGDDEDDDVAGVELADADETAPLALDALWLLPLLLLLLLRPLMTALTADNDGTR
jgi:hypothetical protein